MKDLFAEIYLLAVGSLPIMAALVPADVLVQGWRGRKPVAFDVTVTSPLNTAMLRQ